jgi:hypothetical protein
VRQRLGEDEVGRDVAEALDDDMYFHDNDDMEQARGGPDTFEDISSTYPWNASASRRGSLVLRGATSLHGLTSSLTGRQGTRLISASPLAGRGQPAPLEEELGSDGGLPEDAMNDDGGALAAIKGDGNGQSQSQNAVLDRESNNFLAYVSEAIDLKHREGQQLAAQLGADAVDIHEVNFHDILPPHQNSKIVAAQGLMHVLALGSKNLIAVIQPEAFGAIILRMI